MFPPDDEKDAIDDLVPPFSLLRLIHEAGELPLVFQLEKAGESIPIGTLDSALEFSPDRLRVIRWVCAISSLARDLGADLSAGFSFREIHDQGPIAELMLAARRKAQIGIRVEVTIPEQALEPEKPAAIITNPSLRIGSLVYTEVTTFFGSPRIVSKAADELRIAVESSFPRSVESLQLSERQARTFSWDEALGRAATALESEGFENIFTAPWHIMARP